MADKVIREVERGESPFELQEYQHPKPCQWEEDGLTVTRTTVWTAPGCHEGCGVLVYADKDGNFVKKAMRTIRSTAAGSARGASASTRYSTTRIASSIP